jgi:hypothetical protein
MAGFRQCGWGSLGGLPVRSDEIVLQEQQMRNLSVQCSAFRCTALQCAA